MKCATFFSPSLVFFLKILFLSYIENDLKEEGKALTCPHWIRYRLSHNVHKITLERCCITGFLKNPSQYVSAINFSTLLLTWYLCVSSSSWICVNYYKFDIYFQFLQILIKIKSLMVIISNRMLSYGLQQSGCLFC